jgi:cytoskeletal protein CcmA (bactofilin family)
MWEKDKKEPETVRVPVPPSSARSDAGIFSPSAAPAPATPQARGRAANIGSSLFIKGEVTGSEDLTVEGRVEGKIDLKDHNLTIANGGKVNAEIHAKNVTIVGEVTGNIQADEKVEISDTGRLYGDIQAPRLALSDGAQFRGSVDMSKEKAAAVQSVASIKDNIKERMQAQAQAHAPSQPQGTAATAAPAKAAVQQM